MNPKNLFAEEEVVCIKCKHVQKNNRLTQDEYECASCGGKETEAMYFKRWNEFADNAEQNELHGQDIEPIENAEDPHDDKGLDEN